MKINLIHVGSSYQMGLTNQETQLSLAYKKIPEINSIVVTGENEQYRGCFSILTQNAVKNRIIQGFDVHHGFIRLVREFIKVIDEYNAHIVSVNTNWQLVLAGVARFFSKNKFGIIYTIHGFRHNSRLKSILARYLIGLILYIFADKINAPTSYVMENFNFLRKRINVIPLGEDDIYFSKSVRPDFSQPFNFIFAGVFREGKNQNILISLFSEYLKIYNDNQSKLFLPGEGELRESAMRLAFDLGIKDQVVFPGQLDRSAMLELYNKCQIAIVPTNSETFGHCIAEPIVLQRILITKRIGVAIDIIKHGENGFFFDSNEDLLKCLKTIREMSAEKLMKISANTKITASLFKWSNIAMRHYNESFKPLVGMRS